MLKQISLTSIPSANAQPLSLLFHLLLPLAGGALAVWVNRLEVLGILLLFDLERSPRDQGGAKPLGANRKINIRYTVRHVPPN